MKIGERDKPTHYRIVGSETKVVYGTAPASKALQYRKKLQAQHQETLDLELIEKS